MADIDPNTFIDDDIRAGVCVASPSMLVDQCYELVCNENRRRAIEEAGFEAIRTRDIGPILETALAG